MAGVIDKIKNFFLEEVEEKKIDVPKSDGVNLASIISDLKKTVTILSQQLVLLTSILEKMEKQQKHENMNGDLVIRIRVPREITIPLNERDILESLGIVKPVEEKPEEKKEEKPKKERKETKLEDLLEKGMAVEVESNE